MHVPNSELFTSLPLLYVSSCAPFSPLPPTRPRSRIRAPPAYHGGQHGSLQPGPCVKNAPPSPAFALRQSVMGVNMDSLRPEPCVEGYSTPAGYSAKVRAAASLD